MLPFPTPLPFDKFWGIRIFSVKIVAVRNPQNLSNGKKFANGNILWKVRLRMVIFANYYVPLRLVIFIKVVKAMIRWGQVDRQTPFQNPTLLFRFILTANKFDLKVKIMFKQ